MRNIVWLLILVFSVSSAAAEVRQKKPKQTTEAEEIAKQHDNTLRALRDGLPLVLPRWSLPLYFGMHKDEKGESKSEKKSSRKQH